MDQIDIKRKLLASLGNDVLLQLEFASAGERSSTQTAGLNGRDIELTVASVKEQPAATASL